MLVFKRYSDWIVDAAHCVLLNDQSDTKLSVLMPLTRVDFNFFYLEYGANITAIVLSDHFVTLSPLNCSFSFLR